VNVEAVRDDGALLVSAGGRGGVIVSREGVWPTSVGAALARGEWTDPSPSDVIPAELRTHVREALERAEAFLPPLPTFLAPALETGSTADVTAALGEHTGAMIALVPSDADAERLAVDGGEDSDELHVTLVYLGEAAMIPEEARAKLIECVSHWAADWPTVVGDAFAVSMFNPPDLTAGGKEPCVVLGVSGQQIDTVREAIFQSANATLAGMGIQMHPQHLPWIAHITLVYTDDADLTYFTGLTGPVTFDRIRVAFGGDVYDIPLGDNTADESTDIEENYMSDEMVAALVETSWIEELHPRAPAGEPTGGQFEPADKQTTEKKSQREARKSSAKPDDEFAGPDLAYNPNRRTGSGYGQRGGDRRVKLLQTALNKLGLRDARGNKLDVDGKLGPLTTQAVKAAQRRLGLTPTGVVTPKLLKRLAETPGHLREGSARRAAERGQRKAADTETVTFGADGHPEVPNVLWDWRAALAERDVNAPGPGHDLRNYWVRGPGAAKIRWGADGSFARCVAQLGKYVKNPQGLCAEYHKAATGEWPAEKGVPSQADVEAWYTDTAREDITVTTVAAEADKKPYGNVKYADPGYQDDGVKRYPLDTEAHIRAAWSYINMPRNAAKYDTEDLDRVKARIKRAMEAIGADVSAEIETLVARGGDCPPGHHMMPSGECMSDSEMDTDVETDDYQLSDDTAPWNGVLTVEGVESGDGRMFAGQALSWDEPPLPLMWQKETSHGGGTDVSVRVGSIERIWREPDPSGRADVFIIRGEGQLDLGNPDGAEVHRRMGKKMLRGNSVDVDSVKQADVELSYPELPMQSEGGDALSAMFAQPELTTYRKGRIRATTLCEIPAFTEARLELTDAVTASADDCAECEQPDEIREALDALTAATSVITIPDTPPREWFREPSDVSPLGALTVTDEGRVYGYVAPAGVRHRSFQQKSVYVPLRNVDYSRFHGGETIVADGGRVSTGNITMNCGHATTAVKLSGAKAAEHYDNTCSVVATACVGENEHGVWIAGALLPDVDVAMVRRMMACRLSGDWRTHLDRHGWREFVAALLVPVPGFPMARVAPSVEITEGELVASSVPVRLATSAGEVSVATLRQERVAELAQRVGRDAESRLSAVRARVRAQRIAELTTRVEGFHGTHDQSTHGRRGGVARGGIAPSTSPTQVTRGGDWSPTPDADRTARTKPRGTVIAQATDDDGVTVRVVKGDGDQLELREWNAGTGKWVVSEDDTGYEDLFDDMDWFVPMPVA
jgi:hypothetical protein